jgi:uncharacterized surface protein with fasciclin (FAS1) repeats
MKIKIFAVLTAVLSLGVLMLGMPVQTEAMGRQGNTIYATAAAVNQANGEFDYLIKALQLTGLGSAVDGRRQLTVFAPTDAAFEKTLGVTSPSDLESVPVATLRAILLYHVAPGYRTSTAVTRSTMINTLNGKSIMVNGTVLNGNTNIIGADVKASNGVIHIIDSVLLP